MSGKSYRQAIDAADEAAVAAARRNKIYGTTGDDDLVGTAAGDTFFLYDGGDDHSRGLGGRDRFFFWETFDANDRVNGGDGDDRVIFGGVDHFDLVIGPNTLRDVERLTLGENGTYDITLKDGIGDLRINNKNSIGFDLDASAVTTGSLQAIGDNRANTIIGGTLDDRIVGGVGADVLTGGAGNDVFVYRYDSDSADNLLGVDTITDLSLGDVIRLPDLTGGYHLGFTADRIGDVITEYQSENDRTIVNVFTDSDDQSDMTIYLSGYLDIDIAHETRLIATDFG